MHLHVRVEFPVSVCGREDHLADSQYLHIALHLSWRGICAVLSESPHSEMVKSPTWNLAYRDAEGRGSREIASEYPSLEGSSVGYSRSSVDTGVNSLCFVLHLPGLYSSGGYRGAAKFA